MKERYSHTTRIKSHETDYRLQLKASALLQHFQDVAVHHALMLGVGYEDMKKCGYFWVVTRFHIEINRMPKYDEEITVETWPKTGVQNTSGVSKTGDVEKESKIKKDFIFLRDFIIRDHKDKSIIRATSSWVMLDFKSKRPQSVLKLPVPLPPNQDRHALPVIPQKIPDSQYPMLIYRKQVGYSDIDLNLHVNNTRYADWIMDVFPKEYLEKYKLQCLEINYLREVLWDDKIDLFKAESENKNAFIIEGIEQRTGKASFRAYLKFENTGAGVQVYEDS
jgi:medium-chain acyl-[acyl-carrier-protein] hydrolase